MSTLAEQFHDSFDAYYAGKKTGWTTDKPARRPQPPKQDGSQMQQEDALREEASVESRH